MQQDNWWEQYERVDAPTAATRGTAPSVIYGKPKTPDPMEVARFGLAQDAAARAEQSASLQHQKDALEIEAKRRDLENGGQSSGQRFDNVSGLRKEFTSLPEVKNFVTVLPQVANALQIANKPNPTGADDLNLIYTFGKVMDPGSVVREGELALASDTGSFAQNLEGAYLKVQNGEKLPPEVRRNLVESMRERGIELARIYNQRRDYYRDLADRYGINPLDVIGAHPAGPYQQAEANFTGQIINNRDGSFGAAPAKLNSGGGDIAATPHSFTPEAVVDFAAGLTGGRYEIQRDGTMIVRNRDGSTEIVPVGDDIANSEEYRNAYAAKFGEAPPLQVSVQGGNPSPNELDKQRDTTLGAVDAFVRGAADVPTFGLADELAAGVNTIFGGGTMAENLRNERAIDAADARVNPIARGAGQLAGAVAVPFGRLARTPGELARVGGAGGALYGFGSAQGGVGDRAVGALGGAAAGAVGGYAFGKVANALAGRAPPPAPPVGGGNALMSAARRQGVDPMPADVGGAFTRRTTAAAAQAPLSAAPVIRAGQRVLDQSQAARDRIAGGVGAVLDVESAGEAARTGANLFRKLTSERAARLYDRAEKLSSGAKITPQKTLEALDRNIAELQATPGVADGPQVAALQKLRDQIAGGNFTVAGIRGMRSRLRQQYLDEGLRSSDFQRRVREIVDSASEDMTENLADQGLEEAAQAFQAADGFWRARVETIDKVLAPILGKDRSGEQVVSALESAAKTNGRRLQRFMSALPPEEKSAVQASLIARLGVARAGAQNASGDAFSLNEFLTQWNKMTPRAKAALFPGESRSALNDLAQIAEGSKEAAQYANRSNTGGSVAAQVLISGGAGLGGPVPLALASLGQLGAGKLLASPGFARWLARAPKVRGPGALRAHAGRLANLATQYPALRGEIQQVQQRLLESLVTVQPRVAAEEPDGTR